jgi:glutamine synthetase
MSFDTKNFFELVKEHEIEFVDFRFTDMNGTWHHISYFIEQVTESFLTSGLMFDGSSVPGWKAINESDMIMMPDLKTVFIDPFTAQPTIVVFCDIIDPSTKTAYARDPRFIAKQAEAYLLKTGIGDKAYLGPELEFFIFDDVRFCSKAHKVSVEIDSEEGPYNSDRKYDSGNFGHRPAVKNGYLRNSPVDSTNDIRAEMLTMLKAVGIKPCLHHHEVASSQCELGFVHDTLVATADNVQKYKYVVHNVAHSYGKSATFMPKPMKNDNGSGMHVHQSIWKNGTSLFHGERYANLSETCLYYIGGIIKHAKALNAFTNPSTNSYKRLVPGYEAPVLLAYSACNRSASIRIPLVTNRNAIRIETRFPDPTANPYLCFAAMLMAGLDGIENKIHPGDAIDKNLYELPEEELKKVPQVASSLREALQALSEDREFLKKGGTFSDEQIDAYIKLKMVEVENVEQTPHPIEFAMYYSV